MVSSFGLSDYATKVNAEINPALSKPGNEDFPRLKLSVNVMGAQ